jgi:hypothetical protein
MAKRRKVIEDPIYDFDPNDKGGQSQRYIALQLDELGQENYSPIETITSDQGKESDALVPNGQIQWAKLIREVLTPDYLASLMAMLRDNSSLPELVTAYLFQHLVKIYQYKVEVAV